jgi:hypothetical protein
MVFWILRLFWLPDYKNPHRHVWANWLKTNNGVNGPRIAISRAPVMYRLPNIGKPRTTGSGKSHRQRADPTKGKPAG